MRDDDRLRQERLIFYKNDIDKIDRVLNEFLKLSQARCALIIDKEGHLVTRAGLTESVDVDTISALVAGAFAATKEMARHLGEEEFSVLFHQGKKDSIHLTLIGDRTLLTIIFDERTTIGMVRLYANEAAKKLAKVFATAGKSPGAEETMGEDFGDSAQDTLDDLFGGD
jgi:predicted regulator of Ras-like GTPase activity (Roadblock/LC7/MglB family)